jgi:6-phosphogluconate dehydrogenase-like protein
MNQEIGFVGLGAMGAPMASSLVDAGYILRVYNRTAAKAEPLVKMGATRAEHPGNAARPGGIVITMLADDAALEEVTLGAQGLAERLGRGGTHISMSTVAPGTSRLLAEEHAKRGGAVPMRPRQKSFGCSHPGRRWQRPRHARCWTRWDRQSSISAKIPAQRTSRNWPVIF